jgi:4-amino-4-deoxy-L-arabinose transferase-like glycosyltransferase
MQYIIVSAFYKPYMDAWKANPVTVGSGPNAQREILTVERVSKLVIISNVVTAVMAIGAVMAVFMTVRLLFDDDLAASLAASALACSMTFIFYGHLGNVDVPAAFWMAWTTYCAVKAVYVGKWRHYLLTGLFCTLTVCTKEPMLGYLLGLAIAMAVSLVLRRLDAGDRLKASLISLLNRRVLAAVAMAAVAFVLMNDLLTEPQAFAKRMDFWFETGIKGYNEGITYLSVLTQTVRVLWYSFGWPMLAAIVASAVYCALKYRRQSLWALAPLVVFFVVIILRTRLSIDRYYIPAAAGLAILTGKGCADFLRWSRLRAAARVAPVAVMYLLSMMHCAALDMEMVNDSRYDAENWLRQRVTAKTMVVALSEPAYAPRVHMLGCRYGFIDTRPKDAKMIASLRLMADYIVLNEKEYTIASAFSPEFLEGLLAGKKGYEEVARFSNKYLCSKDSVLGIPGWPFGPTTIVSSDTIILRRK